MRTLAGAPETIARSRDVADPSFDIVSKVDRQEVDNALNQAAKEAATRYDFKGTGAEIAWSGDSILIKAGSEERCAALLDVFKEKLVKRQISLKTLDAGEPQQSGKEYRLTASVSEGISQDDAGQGEPQFDRVPERRPAPEAPQLGRDPLDLPDRVLGGADRGEFQPGRPHQRLAVGQGGRDDAVAAPGQVAAKCPDREEVSRQGGRHDSDRRHGRSRKLRARPAARPVPRRSRYLPAQFQPRGAGGSRQGPCRYEGIDQRVVDHFADRVTVE